MPTQPQDTPQLVRLQDIRHPTTGALSVAECGRHVPFPVKRAFVLYDLVAGTARGGHAHRIQHEFIVCVSGVVEAKLVHRSIRSSLALSSPLEGLYLPPMAWIDLAVKAPDTICLALASDLYDESDYIRDLREFQRLEAANP